MAEDVASAEESSVKVITSSEVSASTVAALRSEIWSLRKSCTEAELVAESLQSVIKSLVGEKYALLAQLDAVKIQCGQMRAQSMMERDCQAVERKELMNELFIIKSICDEKADMLEITAKQNLELKLALQEANEKINNMAMMYLSLKSARDRDSSDE